jgi:uncharacterized RDD family membrane protein YckC
VTKTCTQCGAVNRSEADICCFCDARLVSGNHVERESSVRGAFESRQDTSVRASLPPRVEGNLATDPNWHSEVANRLEAFRAKRRRLRGDSPEPEFQPEFSFEKIVIDPPQQYVQPPSAPTPPAPAIPPGPKPAVRARATRPKNQDRFEIDISQPAFDFNAAERHNAVAPSPKHAPPAHVAPLAQRRRAGLIDAALLLFAFGGFWSLFSALGGHFTFSSFTAGVILATLGLLYAQYFTLFTYFGGSTPGMMLSHLRVVSFDGADPSSQQLLWRSFGYMISAGTAALGFFWALWDEEHLTWQDRISHTYVTPVREGDAADHSTPNDSWMAGHRGDV